MQDSVDDLARIATDIAPIDKGTLRRTVDTKVKASKDSVIGEVSFSAVETSRRGRFNYALWTHEMTYKLGEQSQAAPGVDGYSVGNKYLSRPLYGEQSKYWKWVADSIRGGSAGEDTGTYRVDRAESARHLLSVYVSDYGAGCLFGSYASSRRCERS
ncbi:hypothetical protein [Paenibacillus larvae]|uniref:hypothetical protein n=1 Tax=Paenibacillus larvae TaxID=1464 RepID=UPI001E526714|nr:hypothetical protein [Paenibacillus larvae]